jgi:hypothetical protein
MTAPNLRADVVLFIGGLLMGALLTAAIVVGWVSASTADRLEVRR